MQTEYDVIVIGSGLSGATIARALSAQNKKVLILERGGDAMQKMSLGAMAKVTQEVALADKVKMTTGVATGGASNLYFGVLRNPPLELFNKLGIDLSAHLAAVKQELPIAVFPDQMISAKSAKLRDGANALGLPWLKHEMLIDQKMCSQGYSYEAIWKANSYIVDALKNGAVLINRATVEKILIDKNQAIGVEYTVGKNQTQRVHAAKIVLAAGEFASPQILRNSGVQGIGSRGFYFNPGYALYGIVPGMQSDNSFVGTMGGVAKEGIELGDANVPQFLHRLMMIAKFKPRHLFAYPQTVGISVKVKDSLGGEFSADGKLYKKPSQEDQAKLQKGEQQARRILEAAGAQHVFNVGLVCAGRVGGLLAIEEHVDSNLESQFRNLYVCDGSVVPDDMRDPPALTLLCMAKHLIQHLSKPE